MEILTMTGQKKKKEINQSNKARYATIQPDLDIDLFLISKKGWEVMPTCLITSLLQNSTFMSVE